MAPEDLKGTQFGEEVGLHRPIKISLYKNIMLLVSVKFSWLGCCLHDKKLQKLLEKGKERIQKDLNIEQIVKSLRDIKIFVRNNCMDEKHKFQIQHNPKTVIDLESSDEASNRVPLKVAKMKWKTFTQNLNATLSET
jgi:hypothetical protein